MCNWIADCDCTIRCCHLRNTVDNIEHMPVIPHTLQWDRRCPQNCPFPLGIRSPPNTWFHRLARVLTPTGVLVGSAMLAELVVLNIQIHRQTHRPRYLCSSRPHLMHMHVMRRNNNTALCNAASPETEYAGTIVKMVMNGVVDNEVS